MTPHSFRLLAAVCVILLTMPGCGDDAPNKPPDDQPGELVPDFGLTDVNPSSPTFEESVSPRQLRGRISAWYFTAAT